MTTAGHDRTLVEVELSVHRRATHAVVRLRGQVDVATAPVLRERLLGLLDHRMRLLVLDLSEMSFCDAAGLAVLIGTRRRAVSLGITVRLTSPRPQIAKLLRLHGLDRSFAIYPAMPDPLTTAAPDSTSP